MSSPLYDSRTIVRRPYVFGEVKGSVLVTLETTLDDVCAEVIVKKFKQDAAQFRAVYNGNTYSFVRVLDIPPTPSVTFSLWKEDTMRLFPTYQYSPHSTIQMIPPCILNPIMVPGVIYSPVINDKLYYAIPQGWKKCASGAGDGKEQFFQSASELLDGFDGIESVSLIGLYTNGNDKYGFIPAAFNMQTGAKCNISNFPKRKVPTPVQICQIMESVTDDTSIREIIKKRHPQLADKDEISVEQLSPDTHVFAEKKEFEMQFAQLPKKRQSVLIRKFGKLDKLSKSAFAELKGIVGREIIATSHEKLKELAEQTKANTKEAVVDLMDELKRMSGKVLIKDHAVAEGMVDYAAPYRKPTKEELLKEMKKSGELSSSSE